MLPTSALPSKFETLNGKLKPKPKTGKILFDHWRIRLLKKLWSHNFCFFLGDCVKVSRNQNGKPHPFAILFVKFLLTV